MERGATGAEVVSLAGRMAARFDAAQPTVREVTALFRSQWFPRYRGRTQIRLRSILAEADATLPDRPSALEVHAWLVGLVGAGRLSAETANQYRVTLARCYRVASLHGIACQNQAALCPRLPQPERAPRPLPQKDVTWPKLLAAVPEGPIFGLRGKAFLSVMRFQGLRRGEALGLEWRHVDLRPQGDAPWGVISIEQQRYEDESFAGPLKTAASRAVLPLRPETAEALRAIRGLPSPKAGEIAAFLFPYFKADLRTLGAVVRAALPEVFTGRNLWHILRHAFGDDLLSASVSTAGAMGAMRHASLAATQGYMDRLRGRGVGVSEAFRALAEMGRAASSAPSVDEGNQPGAGSSDPGLRETKPKSRKGKTSTRSLISGRQLRVAPLRPLGGKEK